MKRKIENYLNSKDKSEYNNLDKIYELYLSGDIKKLLSKYVGVGIYTITIQVGYGVSKGIADIFADKKIFGILGNLSDSTKVNKRLAKVGFGNLKIGKHGLSIVYENMYKKLGFEALEKVLSYGYNMIVGFVF